MTVSNNASAQSFTGNGSLVGPFPFTFKVFTTADVAVYVNGILLTLGVDYTITLNTVTDGGNVFFTVAPPAPIVAGTPNGSIERNASYDQSTSLPTNGPLPTKQLESMVDRVVMLTQQLYAKSKQTLSRKPGNTATAPLYLPDPVPGSALKYDTNGNLITSTYDPDAMIVTATALANSAASSASAASTAAASAAASAAGMGSLTVKGSLLTSKGGATPNIVTLPVGTNGQILTADSTQTSGLKWADSLVDGPGVVKMFAGANAPTGFLFCNGAAVSRSTYSNLFTAIGTIHGAGDGSSTFNLPDLRGRFPLGKDDMGGTAANRVTNASSNGSNATTLGGSGGLETCSLTEAQNGPHSHKTDLVSASVYNDGTSRTASSFDPTSPTTTEISGTGAAHNNMPPWLALNFIIKT